MSTNNADQLREMMKDNPQVSPSTFLRDDSFAAYCYDNRDIQWLEAAFNRDADPDDCRTWNITAAEWRVNVEMALLALNGR